MKCPLPSKISAPCLLLDHPSFIKKIIAYLIMYRSVADITIAIDSQTIIVSSKLVLLVTPKTPTHQIDTIPLLGQRIVLLYYDPVIQDHITVIKINVSSLTQTIDNNCCCMTLLRQPVNILYSKFIQRGRNITTFRFESYESSNYNYHF
jgi:hypothetical protein